MVSLQGLDRKQYRERVEGAVPEICCPNPECQQARLRGRGWYRRYMDGVLQPLRRLRCPRCRVSHALLPEDLCAYRDVALGAVEAGLAAGTPSAGAQAAGQRGRPGVRRVRGWLHSAGVRLAAGLQALLAPTAGTWWQRAQQVVGPGPGWLTRLRHWVWQRFSYFLGGLSGLYRQGRPRARPPDGSPYFGNCPAGGTCREASPDG